MRPKTIFVILSLAVTINNLVQGYPKYQRNKVVMNLNPEKMYTTRKSIEVRKNTLFPKNTKKYVVTERPFPRMTAPSSYKYFLVKRPLMLNFDPSVKPLSRYNTSTVIHQPLMKKVKFVVSTPSPLEQDNKKNHWKNGRPIHIKGNKTSEENIDNKTLSTLKPNRIEMNKDIVTQQPFVKMATSANPTEMASENKTREILPVNQEELKSNPITITDEVKDIIAFISKIHTSKENRTTDDKEMTKISTLPPSTEVTKSSSTKVTIEYTTIKNQENHLLKQASTEDGMKDVYILPENYLIKSNTSSEDNDKMTTTLSPVEKSKKSTEFPKPEIVFIPVNFSDLKSHPNLVVDEVQNIVDNINKHVSPMTENKDTATVATTKISSTIAFSTTTPQTTFNTAPTTTSFSTSTVVKTTQIEKEISAGPEKNIKSMEGEPLSDNKSYNTNSDISEVMYHVLNDLSRLNGDVTTKKKLQTTVEEALTSNSSTEILFIPINLDELKSNPNLIADEIKSIAKNRNKNVLSTIESPIITSTEVTSNPTTTTSTTSTPTTTTASTVFLTESTTKADKISTLEQPLRKPSSTESVTEVTSKYSKGEPEIIFIPVNIEDFKTNPSGVINEVQNLVDKMKKYNKNHLTRKSTINQDNQTTFKKHFDGITSEKSFIEEQIDNSRKKDRLNMLTEYFLTTNEIITEPPTTIQAVVSSSTVSVKNVSLKKTQTSGTSENLPTTENITPEPEVIFIPLNLNDRQSNPAIADEVKDIVNYMNKIHPHNNATTAAPDLKKNITREIDLPVKNSFSTPTQETLATKNDLTSSIPIETSSLSVETESTIISSVNSTSYGIKSSTPTNKDQITLRPSQEIIFIPISLEELKSHPDLVLDEVKNVVSRMNDKDEGGFKNSTTEQYSTENTSAKTTTCSSSFYCPENKSKTYLETGTTENVTPKHIFIEPLEVTALKDDADDDIYVSKPFQKQNDIEKRKQEARNGKHNSISDDISDVIYVIKKNKNT